MQADEITYDSQGRIVTAKGHVEIVDDQRTLRADEVTYNQATDQVSASGNVSLQDASGNVAFADRVELSRDLRDGVIQGLAALIGENGRLAAASGERREGRYTIARAAVFTPCAICEEEGERMPLWQVRASRVIHDQLEKELYFEDAEFQFFGVPVFYLPYFSEADPTVRHKSGFLLPDIGSSGYLGTFLKVPYYISLGPSRDLTIDPFFTQKAGTVLQTEYRERWSNDGGMWLQGTTGYDAGASGKPGQSIWMSSLFGSGRIPITDSWRTGFDVQLTSNKTYLQRYELSYADRLTNDLFTDSVDGRSRAALTGYFFQSLRATDVTAQIPLALPFAEYTYIPEDKIVGGRLRVDASALALSRDEGTDMYRASTSADWRRPFTSSDGEVFTLEGFLRGDLYHITDATFDVPTAPKDTETIGRGLGLGMLEWRWPFVRPLDMPNSSLVLEPIVQLIAATAGGNPRGLPNEDSTSVEFDLTDLFSPNPSPGLDLWAGGMRSNAGFRATALLPNGSLEATLGEDFRLLPDPNFAPGSGLGGRRSDIVGQLKAEFPNISLTDQFNVDPENGSIRRNEVNLRARLGRSSVDLSYLKLPPSATDPALGEQEQVNIAATVFVYENWALFGEARRDLAKSTMLESALGIRYEDECFVVQLGFHRRDTATLNLKPASAVIFRLGLKTGLTGG
ncbi:MAG TPA: LPS assembly protein LptD [Micropepsaceae bacterium]|nr:LPS assembly protein LptD [Micropepsaceae bacterium]